MMSDAVSNKGDNENAVAILKEGLERHRENGFAGAVFGEMVRMKSPKEPSKEEMLMNRLNMIKMKCGVEELGEMPNVWSKKG
jgi:hypothetical protein